MKRKSGFQFKDRSGRVHGGPKPKGEASGHAPAQERRGSGKGGHGQGEQGQSRHGKNRPGKDRHGKGAHDTAERSKGGQGKGFGKKKAGKAHSEGTHAREDRAGRRAAKHFKHGKPHAPLKLKASVDKNHKGFAFLLFEDRKREDAFVNPRDAEALFHGDRVEVTLAGRGQVVDIRVLEHRFRELVGRYTPHATSGSKGGWVVYERKRAREEVYLPKGAPGAKTGDWIRAKLQFHESGPLPVTAEATEVYGATLPASADVGMIAAEFNLVEEHSHASIREAEGMRLQVPGRDLDGRADLREMPFITIDGETARDFDDAVFVERHKSGHILWVAIADVSHYVRDGNALDQEARSRGTSVYFPERAFHMLPRALSENLCSLRPGEPRLAMVARMEFDHSGHRLRTEVMEAVIQSKRRATYNEIQAEWALNGKDRHWQYAPHFELYKELRRARAARGSIDFDLPEAELNVAPDGEVISIRQRGRLDAHRLIEEFMIAANEAVTHWMMERSWPFVYRIHEEPSAEKLESFQQLAANVGVRFELERASSPKVLAEIVTRLEGHPAQALLNIALLRSMKQAVYSSTHGIHYGLASEGYTHFTSPIRRYPDLVVHRLLRLALQGERKKGRKGGPGGREELEQELAEICDHCSYRERLAADAEREAIRLKQVRAMVPQVGNEFDARIVGMIETGLFAELAEPFVEGMISRDSMMDDFYQFNEDRMIFYGRRKKRTFKIGDRVRVRVLRADVDKRQIDFGLVESK
ncbi:MAG: ribonuclease R [Oligoflexia bacterium]|nr:ribonuclease R [Oligoflexia bacterium]